VAVLNVNPFSAPALPIVDVTSSRSLTSTDNAKELRCLEGITLTVASGLPTSFFCRIVVAEAVALYALLLESGDFFLLESGDKLMLES
jgi:hypothetical protein